MTSCMPREQLIIGPSEGNKMEEPGSGGNGKRIIIVHALCVIHCTHILLQYRLTVIGRSRKFGNVCVTLS